jgi:hypothetical protein
VFAGIRPMSQTLSWSFYVAADTTGRAVARARRVYRVAWSCVVVFTVGLSLQFGFWYSRMCLFSGDLMTKRDLNAPRHAPAVLCQLRTTLERNIRRWSTRPITTAEALAVITPSKCYFSAELRGLFIRSNY